MAHILVVDDDESVRELVGEILCQSGHSIDAACDGNEALRLYRTGAYDLVITDLVMPEREGLETIRELRRLDPQVRVIAVSGGGQGPVGIYLRLASRLGAVQTLPKPITPAPLLAAVRAVLGAA